MVTTLAHCLSCTHSKGSHGTYHWGYKPQSSSTCPFSICRPRFHSDLHLPSLMLASSSAVLHLCILLLEPGTASCVSASNWSGCSGKRARGREASYLTRLGRFWRLEASADGYLDPPHERLLANEKPQQTHCDHSEELAEWWKTFSLDAESPRVVCYSRDC